MCLFGPGQVCANLAGEKDEEPGIVLILVLFREGSGISVA